MPKAIATTTNDIKSRLSVGHFTTVAARAGCQVSEPHVDRQSIDVTVSPIQGESIGIDVQLKASSTLKRSKGFLIVDIPKKNYDDLRKPLTQNPRLLVVLDLHVADVNWLHCRTQNSTLQKSAYWMDLRGEPPKPNTRKCPSSDNLRQRGRLPNGGFCSSGVGV